ncbi:hypothetical protein CBM2634_B50016 [Cupriavidus taiwanensis]|uniref:Uncharacterized protein n=1 Tax=Cupriavidus taiwanensis TaxID=164546 RepID=A0A375JDA1_9BURK|nr:hypothetical protein CBM2634_B50016 [Cupriavidus taiwanensis]
MFRFFVTYQRVTKKRSIRRSTSQLADSRSTDAHYVSELLSVVRKSNRVVERELYPKGWKHCASTNW